jgi:periplasmic divalent cation tolerance protein
VAEPIIEVRTAVDSLEVADEIAEDLVARRLAACVQIVGPITSRYWWDGEVRRAVEWLCLIKTTAGTYRRLEKALLERHPYDTPEILAVPVEHALDDYAGWVAREVEPGP